MQMRNVCNENNWISTWIDPNRRQNIFPQKMLLCFCFTSHFEFQCSYNNTTITISDYNLHTLSICKMYISTAKVWKPCYGFCPLQNITPNNNEKVVYVRYMRDFRLRAWSRMISQIDRLLDSICYLWWSTVSRILAYDHIISFCMGPCCD